ncbi:hypothetical protein THAOC_13651, partial [Thalassiosira oceanica]
MMGQPQASEYNQHTAVSSTGNTAQGSSQDSRHEICIALGGKQLSKTEHRDDDRSRPRDLKSLSRHLRGGARPSEVIPDLHGIVISKLEALEYIQDMHEGGNKAALASSTRAFIGDVSTTISDLKKPGDLALPSAQLLEDGLDLDVLGAASDSDIAE